MELAPGARLGPYEVLEPLGAGGMGQVWKARDTRLGREVAVKIIAHEKAEDFNLQSRFEREARALSALNHPNIVSVYDVGEHLGAQYIVSELVRGESLRQAISRGPVPCEELLRIASQVSDALRVAHSAGIVHRDLKPDNIMIDTEGRPKILDFGLARRVAARSAAGDSTVTQTSSTQPGTVMGTAGYMSPEQICGDEVDGRSDIFSMGVVLYEMATGTRAFHGRSSIEMMSAILKDDPPHLPAKVHAELDRIIRRCLEKTPANRFQNAAELNAALQALHARAVRPAKTRTRWLALALAAAVLIEGGVYWRLARKNAPRPAVASKSAAVPPAAVLPPLPAVVPASPPAQAPAEPAKAPPRAPVKVERPVPKTTQPGAANEPGYQQAYEQGMLLLAGRHWADSAARLAEAARLKPDSGPARVGLCRATAALQDYARTITECTEAIRLVPNSPDAYHERGAAYLQTQKFDQVVEDMNAAIRLGDTNLAAAHNFRGRAHANLKEWGPAIEDYDEAIRLNPQFPHYYVFRGTAYLARHQNRKALDDFDQALRLQPNLPAAHGQRAIARQRLGDAAGAEADRTQAKTLRGK